MDGMREGWGLEEKEGFKEILNKGGFLTSIGFPCPEENSASCDSLAQTTCQGTWSWVELSLYLTAVMREGIDFLFFYIGLSALAFKAAGSMV